MFSSRTKRNALVALVGTIALTLVLTPAPQSDAADHRDGPIFCCVSSPLDIADLYLFLDPGDNSKAIIAVTTSGFIVPGENSSSGIFDPTARYRFEIENTGDARPDKFIDIAFSPRVAIGEIPQPQTATITLPNGRRFAAPATNPSNTSPTPPAPIVTTDEATGVSFFAGLVDDPFVFDVTAFSRYVASLRAGRADSSVFERGRDTFAGYNMTGIALRLPVSQLLGSAGSVVGLSVATQSRAMKIFDPRHGQFVGFGPWVNVDRMGVPSINTTLVPFNRRNEYNAAHTTDDAAGRFAADIVSMLRSFGTDDASIRVFLNLAVTKGDILRLNTAIPNQRLGSTNPDESATDDGRGFPNGRRYGDDVIDKKLFLINNRQPLSDNANRNETPFSHTFPYFGLPHQPFAPGTVNDLTQN